jgi:hypothetical protein
LTCRSRRVDAWAGPKGFGDRALAIVAEIDDGGVVMLKPDHDGTRHDVVAEDAHHSLLRRRPVVRRRWTSAASARPATVASAVAATRPPAHRDAPSSCIDAGISVRSRRARRPRRATLTHVLALTPQADVSMLVATRRSLTSALVQPWDHWPYSGQAERRMIGTTDAGRPWAGRAPFGVMVGDVVIRGQR